MLRRTFLASPLLLAPIGARAAFAPTEADKADLARIESYLNAITTIRGKFMQVAADGGISGGKAWLSRPGNMRFEYDPPAPFLLLATHGQLVFQDFSIKQTSQAPLGSSPLGILLGSKVALSGEIAVTALTRLPGEIQVSLIRASAPGDGTLTLVFVDKPLMLRQWTVLDAQRKETRITLFDTQTGGSFDPKIFEPAPMPTGSSGG